MNAKTTRLSASPVLIAVLALISACGAATRPPGEVLRGHWQSDKQRELYVGDGTLVWVLPTMNVDFGFEEVRADGGAREVDIRIATAAGVTYRVEFADDYEHGTLTELTQSRTVHQLTRLDDRTAP